MAKSILGEDGNIAKQDFQTMYEDAANHFNDFCHGVALRRADDKELKGLRRVFSVAYDSMRLRKFAESFQTACIVRCVLPYHDRPEDVLYKLAYPNQNLK